jgi:NAD(P)-dependent dehydrogenase (short-subunit alcohol dehydrogenase family)
MQPQKNVAWISGGTSGIGEATAFYMAEKGYAVNIVGRRFEKGQKIAETINNRGGKAVAFRCDVSNEQEVKQSVQKTIQTFGNLTALVNNSGMVHVKKLHEYASDDWDHVMGVNLKSMFFSFKYAYPYLKKNNRSYVVNIGSISSFVGQDSTPVYTTSKHGVLGLTRSIALDYAVDGIRCNCICPGITDTPMLREHLDTTTDPEETLRLRLKRVPMAVALLPEDIAKSIYYFCSENSSGITGTSVTIDGGYLSAAEWVAFEKTKFEPDLPQKNTHLPP